MERTSTGRYPVTDTQQRVDLVVRTIAQTAIDNETYFGDLDSVVGDGDFGYSLARGFEKVIEGWDDIDRTNPGTFLKKVGMIVSSHIGGTSGPIWGTAFMKAGITAGGRPTRGSGAGVRSTPARWRSPYSWNTSTRHGRPRESHEEIRQRPETVRSGNAGGHRAGQPRHADLRPRVQPHHAGGRAAGRQGIDRPGIRVRP